jgi:hypothetical protein
MGQGFGVRYTKCEYNKYFHLGIGMMYSPTAVFGRTYLDNEKPLLDLLVKSKKIKEQAFTILHDRNGVPTDDYGHEVYYCPHCHELYERFHFCITYAGGSFEPEYKCSKCRHLLHRTQIIMENGKFRLLYKNNKPINWCCPQCGNDKLIEGTTIEAGT